MELFPQYADQVSDNLEAGAAPGRTRRQMHAAAENAQGGRVILMNEALVYTAEELGLRSRAPTTAKAENRSTRAIQKSASRNSRRWTQTLFWSKSKPPRR